MKIKTYILILLLSLTYSCKKYDEGGLIRKAEKTISQNTWELQSYFRNGSDETSLVLIMNLIEAYAEDGVMIRSYIDTDGEIISDEGNWSLNDDLLQISLSGLSSIEWSEENSTLSSSHYNIIKLTNDEFWYSYENGGDFHEFHFMPN